MKSLTEMLSEVFLSEASTKEDCIKSLYEYVAGYTTDINHRLRTYKTTKFDIQEAENISSLMIVSKVSTLYRAVLWKSMKMWFGIYKDNIQRLIGKIFVDPGFVSTSIDSKMPWNNYLKSSETVYLTISARNPVRHVDVNKVLGTASPSPSDKEILLDRNTQFRIDSCVIKDGIYFLGLEIM